MKSKMVIIIAVFDLLVWFSLKSLIRKDMENIE